MMQPPFYFDADVSVPPEHDLSCVSQDFDRWKAVCKCGTHTEWTERETWAVWDWRSHVEHVLMTEWHTL